MFADKTWPARAGRLAALVSALVLVASAAVADAKARDKGRKKGKDAETSAPTLTAAKAGDPVYASTYRPIPGNATLVFTVELIAIGD